MGLTRSVSEINGDFIREPQILPTPGVFKALAEGKLGTLEIRYRRSEWKKN